LIVLGVMVAMSVFGAIGAWLRAKRSDDAATAAAKAGLQFSADDPFDCTRVAFALFQKGDGRGAENVMWHTAEPDRPSRVFDYWYYVEHRDEYGRTTKSYRTFSCATALIGGGWPPLTIHGQGLLDKVVDTLGLPDIDFESEEFNRTFTVRCEDRKFAVTLIDPQMMELLLSTRGEVEFELRGRWLLAWTSRIEPRLMPGLLRVAEQFVARIPKVVWDLYPSPFVDAAGKPLPVGEEHARLDALMTRHESGDPWEALDHNPYDSLHPRDENSPDYDLDGHVIPKRPENPWADLPQGSPDGSARGPSAPQPHP
jgi:hypothetical protein